MRSGPRPTAPRLRHEGLVNIGLAIAGAVTAYIAFDEWFFGWMAGLLLGIFGGRAVALRRPDLANPDPVQPAEMWQRVLVVVLVVAVAVALVVALSS